jgi:hypothetical protein
MKYFIALAFAILFISADGQEFGKDLARINNAYFNLNKNVRITNNIVAANGEKSSQIIQLRMKDIDNYYMVSDDVEFLVTKGIKIALSKTEKAIMIDSSYKSIDNKLPVGLFDTMARMYKEIKLNNLGNGLEEYVLTPIMGDTKIIKIQFKRADFLISKIVVYSYDRNHETNFTMTTSYVYSGYTPIPEVNYYIIKTGTQNKYALHPRWKAFELLDYLSRN